MTVANALINFTRSTNGYKLLTQAKAIVGQGTSLQFLGTESGEMDMALEWLVDEVVRDFVDRNPLWFRSTSTLTMAANTRTLAIPTTLRDMDIFRVSYIDADGQYYDNREIRYLPLSEIRRNAPELMQDTFTEDWPRYITINPADNTSAGSFEFYGLPTTARSLEIEMRVSQTRITYAQLIDSSDTAHLIMCPDVVIPVLAHFLAAELAYRVFGPDSPKAAAIEARAIKKRQEWSMKFANPPIRQSSKRLETSGATSGFGGGRFASFARRRGSGRY